MTRFLVVDDDPLAVKGLARLLGDEGHEVVSHTDGANAVRAVKQGVFDAVVTDLEMPAVDGHAVVKAAREHQPNACLLVTTTRGADHAVDGDVCIVLQKPITYEVMVSTVNECRARGGPVHGRCHLRSTPSERASVKEARAELLGHHKLLTTKIERARELAASGSVVALHAALVDIGNLLRLHHLREEALLEQLFGLRVASMVEEHAAEHRQLHETLLVVSTTSDAKEAAAKATDLFDRILAHMAEETLFLGSPE